MEDGDFQGSLSRERRNEGGGLSVRQGFSRLVPGDFSIHVLTPISLCKESTTCIRGNFLSNEPSPRGSGNVHGAENHSWASGSLFLININ